MVEKSATVPHVILYTRVRCHLCEEAKQQLADLRRAAPFELTVIDIDSDAELQRLYNEEVPVVFVHGEKVFKYRIDRDEFLKRIRASR